MPSFSQQSLDRLNTCHPDLITLFTEVIKKIDCIVLEGHRGKEDQEKAVANGNSKLHWPNGKHNATPSLAADVVPYPVDWNNKNRFYLFVGYVLGTADRLKEEGKIKSTIVSGSDWNHDYNPDTKGLIDLPHFQVQL